MDNPRDIKAIGFQWIEENSSRLIDCARRIWEHPELGLEEHRSFRVLADFLTAEGFGVEQGVAGIQSKSITSRHALLLLPEARPPASDTPLLCRPHAAPMGVHSSLYTGKRSRDTILGLILHPPSMLPPEMRGSVASRRETRTCSKRIYSPFLRSYDVADFHLVAPICPIGRGCD